MNRTPRTIASLVATAVLSAGLVTVSAPASTAAPSAACKEARGDVRAASAKANAAHQKVLRLEASIREINRKLARLGTSPEDRNERARLQEQRANTKKARAHQVYLRKVYRNDRAEARHRVERFC